MSKSSLRRSGGRSCGLLSGDAFPDDAQAFVRAGGHGQGEGLAVDAQMANRAFPVHVGDFDVVRSEELRDLVIAGVAGHGE